jgi:glycosyltransferase involved in cell wall biosynthesis
MKTEFKKDCTRPLFSFCLFAYNQEKFIHDAIEGALSQTYSPLEIILSDDCSNDNTFVIMEEMAASYKGPHKIILNKNKINLGVGGHINKVVELAQGEWLVFAAGDDISKRERVYIIAENIIKNSTLRCVMSSYEYFIGDKFKKEIPWNNDNFNHFCGATGAYNISCFKRFDKMDSSIINEDWIYPFRALLIGNIGYIDSCLVSYRIRRQNDYLIQALKSRNGFQNLFACLDQRENDLKYSILFDEFIIDKIKNQNVQMRKQIENDIYSNNSFISLVNSNLLLKIKFLFMENNFHLKKRFFLFFMTFKLVRIIYRKRKDSKIEKKVSSASYTNETFVISYMDLVNKHYKIWTYNDLI